MPDADGAGSTTNARLVALQAQIDALEQLLAVQDETVIVQSKRLEALSEDRRRLFDVAMRVAERERIHVADELHDGAIQHLVVLGYQIDKAAGQMDRGEAEAARASLDEIRAALGTQLEGLRDLMKRLRPPSLDVSGVKAAIEDSARAHAARTGIRTVTKIGRGERFAPAIESLLYRVTLECLSNVAQHSEASHVSIDIDEDQAGWVRLIVADDGVGFDAGQMDALVRDGMFGLAGMRESVETAGGTFEVTSNAGGGTRITVRLPIQRADG